MEPESDFWPLNTSKAQLSLGIVLLIIFSVVYLLLRDLNLLKRRPTNKDAKEKEFEWAKHYLDYSSRPNLFELVDKNEDDQFKLKVIKKIPISPDSYEFTLEFPNPKWISGLWPGGHFILHAEIDGKLVSRKYTPISPVCE